MWSTASIEDIFYPPDYWFCAYILFWASFIKIASKLRLCLTTSLADLQIIRTNQSYFSDIS